MSLKLDTETRREQILEAALKVAGKYGVKGINMNEIATEVGIVPSGIYRHFRNKNEIINALLELIRDKLMDHFTALEKQDISPMDKLKNILAFHITFLRKNRGIPQVIFSDEVAYGDTGRRETLFSIISSYRLRIRNMVEECRQRGVIRQDVDPGTVAFAMISMAQSMALMSSLSPVDEELGHDAIRAWDLFSSSLER